jgi:hypothetical protein
MLLAVRERSVARTSMLLLQPKKEAVSHSMANASCQRSWLTIFGVDSSEHTI